MCKYLESFMIHAEEKASSEMSVEVVGFFLGLSQQILSHLWVRNRAMKSISWLRNQWMIDVWSTVEKKKGISNAVITENPVWVHVQGRDFCYALFFSLLIAESNS